MLLANREAVAERSLALLATLDVVDLDRMVDESRDPPVSAGVSWGARPQRPDLVVLGRWR